MTPEIDDIDFRGTETHSVSALHCNRFTGPITDFSRVGKPGDKAGLSIIHPPIIHPHDGNPMSVGNGSMVALLANDQDHVKRIYDLALSLYRINYDHSLHREHT